MHYNIQLKEEIIKKLGLERLVKIVCFFLTIRSVHVINKDTKIDRSAQGEENWQTHTPFKSICLV